MTHERGTFRVSGFGFRVHSKLATRNSKRLCDGQSTIEYAVVVGLLSGALLTIGAYVQRGMQARYRTMVDGAVTAAGAPTQYEPYYASAQGVTTQDNRVTLAYAPGGQIVKTEDGRAIGAPGNVRISGASLNADDAWQ